jgi:hypothetical protein
MRRSFGQLTSLIFNIHTLENIFTHSHSISISNSRLIRLRLLHLTKTCNLLRVDCAMLHCRDASVLDVRLPRGYFAQKHALHILQCLASGLWEQEPDVDRHCSVEDAEDDVDFPLDVDESGGYKVGEGEVEDPICGCGERDCLAADTEREEFGRVDPRDRAPGGGVGRDEEVGAGDDGAPGGAADLPGFFRDATNATGWGCLAVAGHEACVGVHPDGHEGGADEERPASTPSVDEDEGKDGHEDVDDVLDGGGDEVGGAGQTCHAEDVGDVYNRRLEDQDEQVPGWKILMDIQYIMTFMPVSWDQICVKTPIWVRLIIFGLNSSR